MKKKFILFIILTFFIICCNKQMTNLFSQQDIDNNTNVVKVWHVNEGEGINIYAENMKSVSLTISLTLTLNNMYTDVDNPSVSVIDGNCTIKLASLYPNKGKYSFKYTYKWTLGDAYAEHNDSYIYTLPYEKGKSHNVIQGYNDTFTHFGDLAYSIDWIMDEGTPICAARNGIVVDVIDHWSKGGEDKSLYNKSNHIIIKHNDNTIASYLHIKHNGSVVSIGQEVKAGELIGYSGNVGYSTTPHLHFHVSKATLKAERETIQTYFNTSEEGKTILKKGNSYTRP